MKRKAVLTGMLVLLFLNTLGQVSKAEDPAKTEERDYIKVEMKGTILTMGGPGAPHAPYRILVGSKRFDLDIDALGQGAKDIWRKLDGETIILTGTLSFSSNPRQSPTIIVTSMKTPKFSAANP